MGSFKQIWIMNYTRFLEVTIESHKEPKIAGYRQKSFARYQGG